MKGPNGCLDPAPLRDDDEALCLVARAFLATLGLVEPFVERTGEGATIAGATAPFLVMFAERKMYPLS